MRGKKSALTWATGISSEPSVLRKVLVEVRAAAKRSKHCWRSRHSAYRESKGLNAPVSYFARMVMTRPGSGNGSGRKARTAVQETQTEAEILEDRSGDLKLHTTDEETIRRAKVCARFWTRRRRVGTNRMRRRSKIRYHQRGYFL